MATLPRRSSGSLAVIARPRAAALSVGLGVTAGLITGDNLSVCLALAAAAVLRLPLVAFAAAWAAGLWAGWLLVPVTFSVGQFVLDRCGLGALLGPVLGAAALAVLGWDRYTIVGGGLIAPLLAGPCAWGLAVAQRRLAQRPCITSAGDEHVLLIAPSAGQRLLAWLAGTTFTRALAPASTTQLRRPTWAWIAASVAALIVAATWLPDRHFSGAILGELAAAVGAPLRADHVEVSTTEGKVFIHGLRAYDPQEPSREVLRAETITAKVADAQCLLAGELQFEQVLVTDLRAIPQPLETAPQILPEFAAALQPSSAASDSGLLELPLESQLAGGGKILERLHYAGEALSVLSALSTGHPSNRAAPPDAVTTRTAMRAARSTLGRTSPRISIDYLQVDQLPVCWNLGRDAVIKLRGFDTAATAETPPMQIDLVAPELSLTVATTLSRSTTAPHAVHLQFAEMPATELLASGGSNRLQVYGGTLQLDGQGSFLANRLHVELVATLQGLQAEMIGSQPLAGVSSATWSRCLEHLPTVQAQATLVGTWQQPLLRIDTPAAVDTLAAALHSAGNDALATALVAEYRGQAPITELPSETLVEAAPAPLTPVEPQPNAPLPAPRVASLPAEPIAPFEEASVASVPVEPSEVAGVESTPVEESASPEPVAPQASVPVPSVAESSPASLPEATAPATTDEVPDGVYNPLRGDRPRGHLRRQGLAQGNVREPRTWESQNQQPPAHAAAPPAPEPPVLDSAVAERVPVATATDAPPPYDPTLPQRPLAVRPMPRAQGPSPSDTPPAADVTAEPTTETTTALPAPTYAVQETTAAPIPAAPTISPVAAPTATDPNQPSPTIVTAGDPQAAPGPLDFEVGYDEHAPVQPTTPSPVTAGPMVIDQRAIAVTTTDPKAAQRAASQTPPGPQVNKPSVWARMKSTFRRKPSANEGTQLDESQTAPHVAEKPRRSLLKPR